MSSIVPQNLFQGTKAGSTAGAASASRYPVEFKAGKLSRTGTTVTADKRKGLVYMTKSDDGLVHFCWKDRKSGNLEDDLILFPEEAEWLRLPQCTSGRAYVLKFKSSSQRLFFWMQEPKADKDEEFAKKINDYINDPSTMKVSAAGGAAGAGMEGDDLDDVDLNALLHGSGLNPQQQQLLQMLSANGMLSRPTGAAGGAAGGAATAATAAAAAAPGAASSPKRSTGAAAPAAAPAANATRLASALTKEMLAPVLSDASLRSQLFPALPAGQAPEEVLQSPQFQQAVDSLDRALQSGQLAPLLQELGLDPAVATTDGDRVLALLRAIQRRANGGDAMDES